MRGSESNWGLVEKAPGHQLIQEGLPLQPTILTRILTNRVRPIFLKVMRSQCWEGRLRILPQKKRRPRRMEEEEGRNEEVLRWKQGHQRTKLIPTRNKLQNRKLEMPTLPQRVETEIGQLERRNCSVESCNSHLGLKILNMKRGIIPLLSSSKNI